MGSAKIASDKQGSGKEKEKKKKRSQGKPGWGNWWKDKKRNN